MRPRQKLPKVYIRNGAIYIIRKNFIKKEIFGRIQYSSLCNENNSINIDSLEDLLLARYYLKS